MIEAIAATLGQDARLSVDDLLGAIQLTILDSTARIDDNGEAIERASERLKAMADAGEIVNTAAIRAAMEVYSENRS